MLGDILGGLTNPAAAEAALAALGDAALLERVKASADDSAVSAGTFVAATVRHLLDHGGEDIWLDLLGRMSRSPEPGVAALRTILRLAFPVTTAAPM